MIHPLFKDIVDMIFEQDPVLKKLVQTVKNEESKDDASSEDKKIL